MLRCLRQFPLYNGYGCVGPLFRVLSPLPMNGAVEKKDAMEELPSLFALFFVLSIPNKDLDRHFPICSFFDI